MNAVTNNVDILYIDNDDVDIEGLKKEFKKVNDLLSIAIARNGLEALDKLYGRNGEEKLYPPPKLILLDINLPKMSGIDFLKALRTDPELSTAPVYILTASFTTKDKSALRDLNISGHIIKPIEYSDALNLFWLLLNEQE
jgi:CheY-like chemotaxis protein